MPYMLTFTRSVEITDTDEYINDCCIGGDVILDRLLPALRGRYGTDLRSNQEDWGWFVWFKDGSVKLAVDVSTDDHGSAFQLLLTSRRPRFILGDEVVDCAQLESLRELIVRQLAVWPVSNLTVQRVNEKYLPV
ncbi:hypothetical protein [Roseateles sp.]|uniref:hypothetical protein n=1 Tax=Roseateles sp. TaxID=1971397 RepID=UPI002E083148|nr:hypothetical protein [Roseateles sp.]